MSTEKAETNPGGDYYGDAQPAQHGRQGHLCCGCCCDTRRATIIVNVINIIFAILAVTALGAVSSDSFAANFDDDEVRQELEMGTQYAWVGMLFATISIITSGLGIYGAVKYTGWAVIVAAVWYTINCILSLIGADIGGAIMAGFFAYPHIVFFQEMRKGIMTEQNYPNEIHSCCCV